MTNSELYYELTEAWCKMRGLLEQVSKDETLTQDQVRAVNHLTGLCMIQDQYVELLYLREERRIRKLQEKDNFRSMKVET